MAHLPANPLVVCVANAKGGVGKTTTAVTLADLFVAERLTALAIDLDPTHSLTEHLLGTVTPDSGEGLSQILQGRGELASVAKPSRHVPGLDVVSGGSNLFTVEGNNSRRPLGGQLFLRQAIARAGERWDVVIIDCPPTAVYLLNCALAACRYVLAPCPPEAPAIAGLAAVTHTIAEVIELGMNPGLTFVGVVATNVDTRRKATAEIIDQLRADYGDLLFGAYVRRDSKIAAAHSHARPPTYWRSHGTSDYRDVFREFNARIEATL